MQSHYCFMSVNTEDMEKQVFTHLNMFAGKGQKKVSKDSLLLQALLTLQGQNNIEQLCALLM